MELCFFHKNSVKTIVEDLKIEYLTLFWDDDAEFEIPIDDIIKGLNFIHAGRNNGNVFVHCAQVRIMIKQHLNGTEISTKD